MADEMFADIVDDSNRVDVTSLITEVRALLGVRITAYISSVNDSATVRSWAEASTVPSAEVIARLRAAYRIARLIEVHEGADVARSWFTGRSPDLHDEGPATVLRNGRLEDAEPEVLAAALQFLGS